ncbi:hypothetical protein TKK_0015329 [Trichogramma kaykai]
MEPQLITPEKHKPYWIEDVHRDGLALDVLIANNTLAEMELRIEAAAATIAPEMLHNVRRNFVRRLELCVEHNGGHIEQFV